MAPTPLLLLGVLQQILSTEAATLDGDVYALPARAAYLAWDVVIDAAEDVTVVLQVANDLTGPWTTIDTITLTGSELNELRVAGPTAARFVRLAVTVNASEVEVIGQIIAKAAA